MSNHNLRLGAWGEQRAAEFLAEKGYALLGRNLRTPYGEIDLLVKKEQTLVFVEVKTRSNTRFGEPEEAITRQKREHLIACAEHYLQANQLDCVDWRIDVISILGTPGRRPQDITWFENALA